MPKKFQGENTKSAAARVRKAEAKAAADAKRQKELEDAYWKDEDKHVMRKEQRKEEKEKRRMEQLERKKEIQRLLEEEDSKLKGKSLKPLPSGKITRSQIEDMIRKDQQKEYEDSVEKPKSHLEVPLEENMNRRVLEGELEARTIEDALALLSVSDDSDRHPERRMKAAFAAFEEQHLPRLKKENPNMRLSQLKQLLKKEWMKSPENPMNQHPSVHAFSQELNPAKAGPWLVPRQLGREPVAGVKRESLLEENSNIPIPREEPLRSPWGPGVSPGPGGGVIRPASPTARCQHLCPVPFKAHSLLDQLTRSQTWFFTWGLTSPWADWPSVGHG
uniref:Coiled-coil domain-containing protein n=1 Tax=Ornithorhynchus anatinus TaxID=9258 RepID=A0A6I8N7R8_ORNAN